MVTRPSDQNYKKKIVEKKLFRCKLINEICDSKKKEKEKLENKHCYPNSNSTSSFILLISPYILEAIQLTTLLV